MKPQFLDWQTIEPNVKQWHRDSLYYLVKIWPDISQRVAEGNTWGDEVECHIIHFDHDKREVHLDLNQEEILRKLEKHKDSEVFGPEFTRYMVETEPKKPYKSDIESLLEVEHDLRARRNILNRYLRGDRKAMTLSVFPRPGADPFMEPKANDKLVEDYDNAISTGKYGAAMGNIEARAGRPLDIKISVFRDQKTSLPKELHLNHLVFGPGACGLQATFETRTLDESRKLHDQLTILAPIFLALTASTPMYNSVLVETDTRISQIQQAVDDRSSSEQKDLQSRWATAPMFLENKHSHDDLDNAADDNAVQLAQSYTSYLESHGLDPIMSRYFAAIHLRDPLYLSTENGQINGVTPEVVHKSLLGAFWSHARIKVPDADVAGQGSRVEFRPMELQPDDFANAAFLVFLNLLKQVFDDLGSRLNLWMPLKFVEENMQRAHRRDAVKASRFWFPKKYVLQHEDVGPVETEVVELSIDEIINSTAEGSQGLCSLVTKHLASKQIRSSAYEDILGYLDLIKDRATGRRSTPAAWMR